MNDIYINGENIKNYGAMPCRGFYSQLLTPCSVKDYITNESRLEHGKRVIANREQTKLHERDITLSFFVKGETTDEYLENCRVFIDAVTCGEIELRVDALKCIYKLVYTSCGQYGDYGLKCSKFTLKFKEYNPTNRIKIV